jgi:predicted flap endonuclease-1-like 5' DNA nuclease
MHLKALTTNMVFCDQLDFIPHGAGGVVSRGGRAKCVIVSGLIVTTSARNGRTLLDRNKRGSLKWEDMTSLCALDPDDPHYVPADPPIDGGEPREEDVDQDPGASDELRELTGPLAAPLHEAGFISAHEIAAATTDALSRVSGVGPKTAEKLIEEAKEAVAEAERGTGD